MDYRFYNDDDITIYRSYRNKDVPDMVADVFNLSAILHFLLSAVAERYNTHIEKENGLKF